MRAAPLAREALGPRPREAHRPPTPSRRPGGAGGRVAAAGPERRTTGAAVARAAAAETSGDGGRGGGTLAPRQRQRRGRGGNCDSDLPRPGAGERGCPSWPRWPRGSRWALWLQRPAPDLNSGLCVALGNPRKRKSVTSAIKAPSWQSKHPLRINALSRAAGGEINRQHHIPPISREAHGKPRNSHQQRVVRRSRTSTGHERFM